MPQKSNATWLLVADGAGAQIYVITFAPLHLEKFDSVDGAHHAIQHRPHARQHQEDRFVGGVADYVNAAAAEKKFGRIVIAAPPRALSELRKDLSEQARGLVWVEVPDEWTKLGALDLLDHVRKHLPIAADA